MWPTATAPTAPVPPAPIWGNRDACRLMFIALPESARVPDDLADFVNNMVLHESGIRLLTAIVDN